jgi:hypothetical protein
MDLQDLKIHSNTQALGSMFDILDKTDSWQLTLSQLFKEYAHYL